MKKAFASLLAFWMAACTAIPSPEALPAEPATPPENPPALLQLTETPTKFIPPSITPSITLTPSVTPAGSPTVAPTTLPATLIIPTLQLGSPVKMFMLPFPEIAPWLQMVDAQTGWIIQQESYQVLRPGSQPAAFLSPHEGYILRTADGGKTWQNVTPPTGAYSPGGFFALDANHAWASENVACCIDITATRAWRTTDGGRTWQLSQPFSIEGWFNERREFFLPKRMQFVDPMNGWLWAEIKAGMGFYPRNSLFRTTDGGETWQEINQDPMGKHPGCLAGLAFVSPTTGWSSTNCITGKAAIPFRQVFVESGWKIGHTTDGGNTFVLETMIPWPPELQQLESTNPDTECGEDKVVSFTPDVLGVEWGCTTYGSAISGYEIREYRYFSLSTDEGQTWKTWLPTTNNEYFFNATHGWRLLSPGQLQQTMDGGTSWVTLKMVAWDYVEFDFISEQEGWAVAQKDSQHALVHTTDGGKTWEEIKPVIAPQ